MLLTCANWGVADHRQTLGLWSSPTNRSFETFLQLLLEWRICKVFRRVNSNEEGKILSCVIKTTIKLHCIVGLHSSLPRVTYITMWVGIIVGIVGSIWWQVTYIAMSVGTIVGIVGSMWWRVTYIAMWVGTIVGVGRSM